MLTPGPWPSSSSRCCCSWSCSARCSAGTRGRSGATSIAGRGSVRPGRCGRRTGRATIATADPPSPTSPAPASSAPWRSAARLLRAEPAGADLAHPHPLRVVADLDAGDLLGACVGDHRHGVVAAERDEAVAAVAAVGRPVRLVPVRGDPVGERSRDPRSPRSPTSSRRRTASCPPGSSPGRGAPSRAGTRSRRFDFASSESGRCASRVTLSCCRSYSTKPWKNETWK